MDLLMGTSMFALCTTQLEPRGLSSLSLASCVLKPGEAGAISDTHVLVLVAFSQVQVADDCRSLSIGRNGEG